MPASPNSRPPWRPPGARTRRSWATAGRAASTFAAGGSWTRCSGSHEGGAAVVRRGLARHEATRGAGSAPRSGGVRERALKDLAENVPLLVGDPPREHEFV